MQSHFELGTDAVILHYKWYMFTSQNFSYRKTCGTATWAKKPNPRAAGAGLEASIVFWTLSSNQQYDAHFRSFLYEGPLRCTKHFHSRKEMCILISVFFSLCPTNNCTTFLSLCGKCPLENDLLHSPMHSWSVKQKVFWLERGSFRKTEPEAPHHHLPWKQRKLWLDTPTLHIHLCRPLFHTHTLFHYTHCGPLLLYTHSLLFHLIYCTLCFAGWNRCTLLSLYTVYAQM